MALIRIGLITGAHGIRGEVKVKSFSEQPEALFSYAPLTDETGQITYKLTLRGSLNHGQLIAAIDGVSDRNAAEKLKDTALYVSSTSLPPLTDDSWYYASLVGLEARLANGECYGRVIAMHNFGAGDIMELELTDGTLEMLPFNDDTVPEIAINAGYVRVNPPEYLIAGSDS